GTASCPPIARRVPTITAGSPIESRLPIFWDDLWASGRPWLLEEQEGAEFAAVVGHLRMYAPDAHAMQQEQQLAHVVRIHLHFRVAIRVPRRCGRMPVWRL